MGNQTRLISHNPIFRRLWLAQTGSSLGDWFNQVALATTTLALTHSPAAMSFVLLARDVPQVLLSAFSGPLLDRYSKRALMIISDFVRVFVVLVFIWAALQQQMWAFYGASVLMGMASALFAPARNATIPAVVAEDDLTEANTLTVGTAGVLAIVGAAAGGLISTWFQPSIAFLVNALSYLWSAVWILATRWKEGQCTSDKENKVSYGAQLREGFQAVLKNRKLAVLIGTSLAFALSAGPYFVMVPVLGDLTYHLGGIGIGLLYVADGTAFILSALLINRMVRKSSLAAHRWYGLGFIIQAVFFTAFSFSTNVWSGMIFLFFAQMGSGILITLNSSLMQMTVPSEVRGRVFALEGTLYTGTSQISLLLVGPALALIGSPSVGMIVGVISLIAALGWRIFGYGRHEIKEPNSF
ncbi:MAG TPA: MFS transporter [Bacillales bacterium]|nr:MFS transporter [Bacillales bacterium]